MIPSGSEGTDNTGIREHSGAPYGPFFRKVGNLSIQMIRGPWLPTAIAVAAFIGFVSAQSRLPILGYEINADSVYVFMITKDLVFDRGSLSDWFTAPHLYIYPDFLMALSVVTLQRIGGVSVFTGCVAVYGVALICVIAFIWRKTTAQSLERSFLVGSVALGIIFGADYLLYKLVALQDADTRGAPIALDHIYALGQILGPGLHSGAFIIAFVSFFPLYGLLIRKPASSTRTVLLMGWLSCNVLLVTLSDLIFAAWGIIPLSIIVLSGVARNPRRRSLLLMAILWVSGALGYLLSWLIGDEVRSAYFAAGRHPVTLAIRGLIDLAGLAGSMTQPVVTLFLVCNIALWSAAVYALLQEITSSTPSVCRSLTIFAGGLSGVSVLAPVAVGLFTGEQVRYLMPYIVLGPSFCVFLGLLAAFRLLSPLSWFACLTFGALMIFAGGAIAWNTLPGPTASQLYECLKLRGLKYGRANYWDAAPIVATSGWQIKIIPLAPGTLDIFPWLAKRQWLQRQWADRPSNQDVLIVDADTVHRAIARYGLPDRSFICADRRIMIYNHVIE